MATPLDFGTPLRIITEGLREAGKIAADVDPDSDQLARGMNLLADILNHEQTKGIKLWTLEDIAVPLTVNINTYTFGPGGTVDIVKPFRVEYGYYEDTPGNRRPLDPLSWTDYLSLSQNSQTGAITGYFVDKQLSLLVVKFWMTPDTVTAAGNLHLLFRKRMAQMTNLMDTMIFPPEWFLALRWAVADNSCGGQPIEVQQRCMMKAETYLEDLRGFDIEDVPTSFSVDRRGADRSRFR